MGPKARVGFHAAANVSAPLQISVPGNDMASAYLQGLGITDLNTIKYLISRREMTWFTLADTDRLQIEAKVFSFTQEQWMWVGAELNARRRIRGVDPIGTHTIQRY
jgi:hypothetical protein